MQEDDLKRELEKVESTLRRVYEYLSKMNESNAQLHMSDKVMYSPLTNSVALSLYNVQTLISRMNEDD